MQISPPRALSVRLFGSLELTVGGARLELPPSTTARSLLAYLLLHHDRPLSRERLMGLFWADRSEEAARAALSRALWQIRRCLGPAADRLGTDRSFVALRLRSEDRIDVDEFLALCSASPPTPIERRRCLEEAVTLYRGDLLEEVYEDWPLLEREQLRELYLQSLEELIVLLKQLGKLASALPYAHRLLQADPFREPAHLELMRLYLHLGQPHQALHRFRTLRRLLQEEFGLEPSREAQALHREVLQALKLPLPEEGPEAPPRDRTSRLPLVGRRGERATLIDALQRAARGQGGVVFVEGRAGIGKTRLVEELILYARWIGFEVGVGHGAPEAGGAYQPLPAALAPLLTPLHLAQILEQIDPRWLTPLVPFLPVLRSGLPDLPNPLPLEGPHEAERHREAFGRLLRAFSQVHPLLLVLEDLHWADEAALLALPALAEDLGRHRILLVLTYRSGEAHGRPTVREALQELGRRLPPVHLELRPLTLEETGLLADHLLGRRPEGPWLRRLWEESGGTPLLLIEALRALREGEEAADLGSLPILSLASTLQARILRLPPHARQVLETAAVLGQEIAYPLLAHLLGPGVDLLPALETLERQGFLRRTEAHYRFEHERIRETVYEALPEARRRELHRRAARTLETLEPDRIEALAHHFLLGEVWDQALRYHREAGDRNAARGAFPTALHHYDRALGLAEAAGLPAAERFDLLARRERVADVLARRELQERDLEEMLRLARNEPGRYLFACERKVWMLLHLGRPQEAETLALEALERAEREGIPGVRVDLLIALGTLLDKTGRAAEALPYLEEAVALAEEAGDLRQRAKAAVGLGSALLAVGEGQRAEAALNRALAFYASLENPVAQAEVFLLLGVLYMERGQLEMAEVCYTRSLDLCREIHNRLGEGKTTLNLGNVHFVRGDFAAALRCYDEAIELLSTFKARREEALARLNRASLYLTVLGRGDWARENAERGLTLARQQQNRVLEAHGLSVLASLDLQEGRLARAETRMREVQRIFLEANELYLALQAFLGLAKVHLEKGAGRAARELLEEAEALAQKHRFQNLLPPLWALMGEALLLEGRADRALPITQRAMDRLPAGSLEALRIPYAHARVLLALNRPLEAWKAIDLSHRILEEMLAGFPPEAQAESRSQVPLHRCIVALWEALGPRRISVRLPRPEAPTGRPLREDETVDVVWTVAAPEDLEASSERERRRRRLLRLLDEARAQGACATVERLAEALQVSPRTIKRDLAALRSQGYPVATWKSPPTPSS